MPSTPVVITLVILFTCMIALCFAAHYGMKRVNKGQKPSIVSMSVIPLANVVISWLVVMFCMLFMPSSGEVGSVYFLAGTVFLLSGVARLVLRDAQPINTKYFVNGLNGISSSVMCERENENQALWEAYQLAKQHNDMVFAVTDTRGRKIAIVNHADVSIQMLKSKFGL